MQVKLKEAEASVQETIKNCDVKLNEKEEQIRYLDQLHRDLTINTDSEMKSLKLIIETQKQELDTERLALKEKDGVMQ